MFLIVGLGNPGRDYQRHRHNVGAVVADAVHKRHGFGPWRRRFSAAIAEGSLAGVKTVLMKPTTYMNESGRAVGEALRFHKIGPADILVIHDELDLAPGKMRVKTGGGGAGHNGIRSLTAHLGPDYRRLRIGIGHPGHRDLVTPYVLHDFAKADAEWLTPLIAAIADHAPLLASGNDAEFANRVHLATAPPKDEAESPSAKTAKPAAKPASAAADPPKPIAAGPFAGLRRLFGGRRSDTDRS